MQLLVYMSLKYGNVYLIQAQNMGVYKVWNRGVCIIYKSRKCVSISYTSIEYGQVYHKQVLEYGLSI